MPKQVAWGILATGRIASTFAKGLAHSQTGKLVAVGSRTEKSANRFGDEHDVPRRHGSYEELLADPQVEAVYIATPHPLHAQWAIRSAEAGKHILCEKPLGLNHAEAMAVVEAAREHDVFLMEAFMYRCHPQTHKLVELIRRGAIGEVRAIQATFSFNAGENWESRTLNHELGGGGILDVGCYCTSMARLLAGAAVGKPFEDPVAVKGLGHLGDRSRVDEWAVASLKFASGIVAELATGVRVNQENVVWVYGAKGRILVPWPWIPGREGQTTRILIYREGEEEPEEIVIDPGAWLYALEADTLARHLDERQPAPPAMTWDDTLGNMKTLDAWRQSFGFEYDMERPAAQTRTVSGRPLRVRANHPMKYGEIRGIQKPVARVVMGVDNQSTMPHAAALFDAYFEHGGNAFDTAYIYHGGLCERLLGHWVQNRGVREQVVLIDKGAHTPFCFPGKLREQLDESLSRLQTEHVDLYLAHRDNPEVPVDEWAVAFNELLREGLIHAYGGSNWSIARVESLNSYAKANGLVPMSVVSNQFSLARMVEPVWAGCLSASDRESRTWFESTNTPLLPWSSQARGFFTDRATPDQQDDAELVRCWYAEDNFERQRRAKELAARKEVPAIVIALAYVLNQPFPTFPLIGPRTLSEFRMSMEALPLPLTAQEIAWLNLEGA